MTRTGTGEEKSVPSPSWPEVFLPQQAILPSSRPAQEWKKPAVTEVAVAIPAAGTGFMVVVGGAPDPGGTNPAKLPFPSCPSAFSPQQKTLLFESAAHECERPAATETAPDRPGETGVLEEIRSGAGQNEPSCPEELSPQHLIEPSPRRAQVWLSPALNETAFERPVTSTGESEPEPVGMPALPSWSKRLEPQHRTPPPETRAQVWVPPAETAVAPARPVTAIGEAECAKEPLPSCPNSLFPQHATVPFERTAQVCEFPAEIEAAPIRPDTSIGVVELATVALPSWPKAFLPQHRTVPS